MADLRLHVTPPQAPAERALRSRSTPADAGSGPGVPFSNALIAGSAFRGIVVAAIAAVKGSADWLVDGVGLARAPGGGVTSNVGPLVTFALRGFGPYRLGLRRHQ